MNNLTKLGLNLLQQARLDRLAIKALNNKFFNPLMFKYCWQERNYESFLTQYRQWREKLEKNGVSLKAKKILEIGSGGSIGLGYFFLKHDFKLWASSDLYQDLNKEKKLIASEKKLIKNVYKNYDRDIFKQAEFKDKKISFGPRFDFFKLQAETLREKFIGDFDIILSAAVLEHLPREIVTQAVGNFNRYLPVGGLMIHDIDLRDHINVASPYNFYKYDEAEWNKLTQGSIFYTNRLRLSDYLNIFTKHNFKIKYLEKQAKPLPANIKINNFFRSYQKDDLETINAFIILEKTADYHE
ncbi:MAG: class I SAM-dependent methyltransferase [Patescibacteria group bacterium]